jgi:hypothetical protein
MDDTERGMGVAERRILGLAKAGAQNAVNLSGGQGA